jgi:thiamine-phosphate pyrophosphorylase
VEDYVRFVLDDPFLTTEAKSLRHELIAAAAAISPRDRHAARDTARDVGTDISTPLEHKRSDVWDVCAASLKRTEQSLRSLEEYGKLADATFARLVESLRYKLYTLEKAIDTGRFSRDRISGVRLCVLIDGQQTVADFARLVSKLVEAGAGMIQLRDKQLDDRELVERARQLVLLTRDQSPAPLGVGVNFQERSAEAAAEPGPAAPVQPRTLAVINDRPDVAAAVHADGVHVGQEDLHVKDVRTIVGTQMLIGVSTHNIEQARAAVLDGASYLGAGPTFPSITKSFESFAGVEYLEKLASEIRLPTFAIGGITASNLPDVLARGISRVAVGSAIAAADDPASAVRELLGMLNKSRAEEAASAIRPLTSDL